MDIRSKSIKPCILVKERKLCLSAFSVQTALKKTNLGRRPLYNRAYSKTRPNYTYVDTNFYICLILTYYFYS